MSSTPSYEPKYHLLLPRPRNELDMAEVLQARIRDPLWMLARQWQLGEFQGEDAGAPAYVQVARTCLPLTDFAGNPASNAQPGQTAPVGDPVWQPLPSGELLEPLACSESFDGNDLRLRAELGQLLGQFLVDAGLSWSDCWTNTNAAKPYLLNVEPPVGRPETPAERSLRIRLHQRVYDAKCFWELAFTILDMQDLDNDPDLSRVLSAIKPQKQQAFLGVLNAWLQRVQQDYPGLVNAGANSQPPGWTPSRLEQNLLLRAGSTGPMLTGSPDGLAELDWYSFDAKSGDMPSAVSDPTPLSVIPGHVRFPGMPAPRWWDFEDNATSILSMDVGAHDLARLLLLDFVLVQGVDWFQFSLEVPLGTLVRIDALTVTDVFGQTSVIRSAESCDKGREGQWSLFRNSGSGPTNSPTLSPYLVVAPSTPAFYQHGQKLEEVLFARDEQANLVWGIEQLWQDRSGQSQPGRLRSMGPGSSDRVGPPTPARDNTPPDPDVLEYVAMSDVPPHWIPFLPRRFRNEQIRLEKADIRCPGGRTQGIAYGRILNPAEKSGLYRLFEEAIPRSGVKISRAMTSARTPSGQLKVWMRRQKETGSGEADSGLQFDQAEAARK